MFTDQPVEHIKDDQLRRMYLADEIGRDLVQSLQNTTDSFVVGINGPWGSGQIHAGQRLLIATVPIQIILSGP